MGHLIGKTADKNEMRGSHCDLAGEEPDVVSVKIWVQIPGLVQWVKDLAVPQAAE